MTDRGISGTGTRPSPLTTIPPDGAEWHGAPDTNLDARIDRAAAYGHRYTPTHQKWFRATKYQRSQMTWPDFVLDSIRRNP